MHLTLREMRRHFSAAPTWVALAGVAVVLTLVAPYGSDGFLSFAPRLVYWAAVVCLCYGVGFIASTYVGQRFGPGLSMARFIALAGTLCGLGVSAVVLVINYMALDFVPPLQALPLFLLNVFGIAFVVTGVIHYVTRTARPEGQTPRPPALLDRLPLDKRGALVALSVEDHYVRVQTTKGQELILMRLSDAMKEVGDTDGLQVHRSHWVTQGAVTAARREGDRAVLTMTHGADIPVSRRYVPAIKEAGLLPK